MKTLNEPAVFGFFFKQAKNTWEIVQLVQFKNKRDFKPEKIAGDLKNPRLEKSSPKTLPIVNA